MLRLFRGLVESLRGDIARNTAATKASAQLAGHAAAHKRVAAALWDIAQEHQAKAELGKPPDIGDPPSQVGKKSS